MSSQSGLPTRRATHAGSWYTGDGPKLYAELNGWLSNVGPEQTQANVYGSGDGFNPPVKGCKAIIAPHAGYAYSGPAAAWAYKSIDTTGIKRVFILGPSHHVYLDGCALSKCGAYQTPIGDLPLDRKTIDELKATGSFSEMSLQTDEDEHSIEMHLPYVRKMFEGIDIEIVPILVGSIHKATEQKFGATLAPFLQREDTFTVVSSDFCHWGTRFNYTFYYTTPALTSSTRLTHSTPSGTYSSYPIFQSITDLDREAMDILASSQAGSTATHDSFNAYLARTKNTICGRRPIGVLLGVLKEVGTESELTWVRYEQSSPCKNVRDSSVSYASAYVVF